MRKRYPAGETSRFKCFGSGHRNEALLAQPVAVFAPRLLHAEAGPRGDVAYLERLAGHQPDALQLTSDQAVMAGRRLAGIHAVSRPWYGSLDGRHQFQSWAESWVPRWEVMTALLAGIDPALADTLRRWGRDVLPRVADDTAPALVHGDFGPRNLLWPADGTGPWVLDWEHARYGHPAEDFAKLRLAELFPEPNGFRQGHQSRFADVERGWREVAGAPAWSDELTRLLMVYFAGTLGIFLDSQPSPRLGWLRSAPLTV